MLEGWLAGGLSGSGVTVIDPHPSDRMIALCEKHGCALNPALPKSDPAVLVLAIKPQTLDNAGPMLAALVGPETLVVSVLAGKTVANLAARMSRCGAIVRTIPNTPASVGRGITAAFPAPTVSDGQRELADHLLAAIGRVVWVDDENLIDAATAVSGSGPAYVFYLAECLAAAGTKAGLPHDVAMALARATVEGAGELLYRDALTAPAILRQNVTSPNGTTAAALAVLMASDGMEPLLVEAVAAAKRRAAELSG